MRADRVDTVRQRAENQWRQSHQLVSPFRNSAHAMGAGSPWTLGHNIQELPIFHHRQRVPQEPFLANSLNANLMLTQITRAPCLAGVIPTATAIRREDEGAPVLWLIISCPNATRRHTPTTRTRNHKSKSICLADTTDDA